MTVAALAAVAVVIVVGGGGRHFDKHVPRCGLADIALQVFGEQEAIFLQLFGGLADRLHIAGMAW